MTTQDTTGRPAAATRSLTCSAKSSTGPAFPPMHNPENHPSDLTLRQYAAIHLRQPISGIDWLDDAIRAAQRDEFAGKALMWAGHNNWTSSDPMNLATRVYLMADAMMEARK